MSRETKTLHFQVKTNGITTNDAGQEFGQIEAYGAVFNNVDEGNDRILKGSFARTINNSKSRAKAREKKYLIPMLWQHDTNELIGGWYDLKENDFGLLCKGEVALATQRGREYYELAKAGMTDQFSVIYDVPSGGAKYTKDGVRDLSEMRLFSVDPVVFAMNDETLLVGVKSASGKIDWPLGDRNTTWDGQAAHNAIVKWASQDDGSTDTDKMKSVHFWYDSATPDKITSYKLAFCDIVDDKPTAMPKGIFACAGSHGIEGADIPESDVEGVKAKIAAYYRRMAKEFDDDSIKVPWSDGGEKALGFCLDSTMKQGEKGNSMQKKTLLDHYKEEMAEDLLTDWQDVYVCALTASILDALKIGDQPQADISQALDDFKALVLEKFVTQAQEVGLSQYLLESGFSYSPADYTMQYGSESKPDYGYMSSSRRHARKAGRAISASNSQAIQGHVDTLHDMADKMSATTKEHTKAMRTVADDLATLLQGSEAAYGSDAGKPDAGQQEGKSHQNDLEIDKALSNLRALRP